jgi:(4S)-4-hydroxy-5-phosphonooxypentane-2,3-dione isomerase
VPVHPDYKDRDVHFAAFLVKAWPQWLAKLEAKITEHGGSFLLGKKLTLADLVLGSDFFATSHSESFENSHILESVLDQYPKVKSWINDLHKQFATFLKAQEKAFANPVKKAPRQSDAFTLIVKLTVKPGRLDEFQKMISTACTESRKEPGCIRWDLMRDRTNKCVFHLYEVYTDKVNAFTAHTKTDHFKAFLAFKASGGFEGKPEASAPESIELSGFEKPVKYGICIMNPDGGSGVNGLVKLTHVEGEKCKIHVRITGLAPG